MIFDGGMRFDGTPAHPDLRRKFAGGRCFAKHSRNEAGYSYYDRFNGVAVFFPDVETYPKGGYLPGEDVPDGVVQAEKVDSGSSEAPGSADSGSEPSRSIEAPGSGEGEPQLQPVDPSAGQSGEAIHQENDLAEPEGQAPQIPNPIAPAGTAYFSDNGGVGEPRIIGVSDGEKIVPAEPSVPDPTSGAPSNSTDPDSPQPTSIPPTSESASIPTEPTSDGSSPSSTIDASTLL